jgi:hypothetical protein
MRKIFTNPIAIAIAIASVHWLIIIFAMHGETYSNPSIGELNQSLLVMILIVLNIPALLMTTFFAKLFLIFGEITYLWTFLSIIFITLQWLLIGYFIAFMSGEVKPTKFNLSLIDE